MLLDFRRSKGTVFHSLVADTEKEFSNRDIDVLNLDIQH